MTAAGRVRSSSPPLPSPLAPAGTTPSSWSADPYADALRTGRGPLFLRCAGGRMLPLDVERWCAAADAADHEVLRRCEGPVLDVGCGPGRLVTELSAQGRPALGVDVSEAAVDRTRRLGGRALHRSVFTPLPDEGRWGTALLIDGNVGIGGDPLALLARMSGLLRPGGLLIAETAPVPDTDERLRVRIVRSADASGDTADLDAPGAPFRWARLGAQALLRYAARTGGWHPAGQWASGGRCFVALRSRRGADRIPPPADIPGPAVAGPRDRPPVVPQRPSGDSPLARRTERT
ncbi:methyltransferase type 11 [Streptomyces minutiscleroticus]|uniref:Methyltransferase type 11 n=1 Tax=Streptomyces minutiscleroticus TaxID=68238 RepID=A0A918NGQ0_9ACTN|nr:class I SAM-dependent methyltransferase [Streptomyces minutiscleroticus]GGX69223.1 methyltransferase type 11 [Streptomyces minutiscleroticus]